MKPDAKWGNINGEELVVRGSNGRRAQISRARLKQFTPRVEARFLSVLSRTCNVKLACAAVGMSAAAAYNHRDRWVEFERAWDEAVEDGEVSLQCALLENGIRTLDPDAEGLAEEPALPMQPMSTDDVIRILGQRRAGMSRKGKFVGNRRMMATEEETNAALLKRLKVLAIRKGVKMPAEERQWKGRRGAKP